jgi:cell division cycle protein 20 (cofactor of APC complex)
LYSILVRFSAASLSRAMPGKEQSDLAGWDEMMSPDHKRPYASPSTQPASSRYHAATEPSGVTAPKRGRTLPQGDRFIPQRSAMNMDVSHFEVMRLHQNENAGINASPAKEEYKRKLAANLFDGSSSNKVFAFRHAPPPLTRTPSGAFDESSLRVLYTQNRAAGMQPKRYSRHIPQAPERILDAPELLDDYYLNLLDWSPGNVLAVALSDSIYLWNATDGSIQQLMQTQGDQTHVTSLSWAQVCPPTCLAPPIGPRPPTGITSEPLVQPCLVCPRTLSFS